VRNGREERERRDREEEAGGRCRGEAGLCLEKDMAVGMQWAASNRKGTRAQTIGSLFVSRASIAEQVHSVQWFNVTMER
jgi:hypothetical protein